MTSTLSIRYIYPIGVNVVKVILAIIVIVVVFFVFQLMSSNKKVLIENKQAGADFLKANQQQEGVKTTASGLQYQVLVPGTGDRHPTLRDSVTVHYHGKLLNGVVFDSSVERGTPIEFSLNQVIKGWTEGLQLMVIGEKTRLFIPSDLAYGNHGAGKIPPGSTLIFDVELLEIIH